MRLGEILERQAGVVSLTQVRACGISPDVAQRRAASGEWTRLHPAVYLVGGHPRTDDARIWAAALWAGAGSVVSGQTAAYCHGLLRRPGAPIEVTISRARNPRATSGVRVRRRDLPPADVTTLDGLPTTAAPFTALTTAIAIPDGSMLLDRALQRGVTLRDLNAAYARHRGAAGWTAVATLLTGAGQGEFAAERLLVRILRSARITGWELGRPFPPWTVDLAFPAVLLAVEVDGWAWHHQVERFGADRRKQNALIAAGWTVLRFTWHDLHNHPERVCSQIQAALRRAA